MDINELRLRIIGRDPAAYLDLSNEYGWKLYSYLSKRIKNKDTLAATYEQVLRSFYESVAGDDRQGSIESLLYEAADRACGIRSVSSPKAANSPAAVSGKKRGGGFLFWFAFLLLLALNAVCLWIIAGILMDMGFLPEFDLGYSWFHTNVAPLVLVRTCL